MVVSRTFINDRHAEEPLQVFDQLVAGLTIDGCQLGSTLRVPFFADCLGSDRYLSYASRTLLSAAVTALFLQFSKQPSKVLFVTESARHEIFFQPVQAWLSQQGIASSLIQPVVGQSLPRRIKNAVPFALQRLDMVRTAARHQRHIRDYSQRVQQHFGFSPLFNHWFAFQTVMSYVRYGIAVSLLKSLQPKLVFLCSEYTALQRPFLLAAQHLGIATINLQHGFLGSTWVHMPSSVDKLCVWGEVDRAWFIKQGVPASKIAVTGSPRVPLISADTRMKMREQYSVQPHERAILFFAPNLSDAYHERASALLHAARDRLSAASVPTRWFVRLHPSQANLNIAHYESFEAIPTAISFEHALAVSDLALHDYSTMAEAVFVGAKVACLQLDAPYPDFYADLLGDQVRIVTADDLICEVERTTPGLPFFATPNPALSSGNIEAVSLIGRQVIDLLEMSTL